MVNLISVPYYACIIAHEHMGAYAYISILDALLKLSVAFMLTISPVDKLITYSFLLFVSVLLIRFVYGIYCKRNFDECRYRPIYERSLFKEMLSFAGWNFFGNAISILNTQGINILMNVFFGVFVNSARGIASQVDAAVTQFVHAFTTAINPQITKSYAQGDNQRLYYLICKGAKFSFFLLLLIVVPLYFEAEVILKLWLVDVPEGAAVFMKLALLGLLVSILGNSGYTACIATGRIKKYSILNTLVGSMNFIITWVAYSLGAPAQMTYIIYIIVYMILQIVRLVLMKEMIGFPIMMFIKEVIYKLISPLIFSVLLPLYLTHAFEPSLVRAICVSVLSVLWTTVGIILFGLTPGERSAIFSKLKVMFGKFL